MKLRSLGLSTELMLRSFEGEVEEKPEYVVIRTPQNPGYRWGNFLIFREPPKVGDLERWKAIFAQKVGVPPRINHYAFTWDLTEGNEDSPEGKQNFTSVVQGAIEQFLEAGFKLQVTTVMTAQSVNPPIKFNDDCRIRVFEGEADWQEWLELALAQDQAENPDKQEGVGYREFLEAKIVERQRMIDAAWGQWFGAYVNGRLASTMGLFVRNGLGRFQSVDTHPEFRRLGLAGTLLYQVSRHGFEAIGAKDLVILADDRYFAKNIYASVGFKTTERYVELEWLDRSV